jgi:muramoyltetrapeptide carboxypeptidase LdcA involved in peptidoglycan recycling
MKMNEMIKPKKLQPGDKIATVSLSWGGPGTSPHRYEAGKKQLMEAFDVEVIESPHALREAGWLHKNPQARADDLMWAFSEPTINGIISNIGGSDSIRLLPFLDLDVIRNNPKVFMGYSDTTISHMACFKAGLVSFYGPAIMAGFGENGGLFPYMQKSVQDTLFSSAPIGEIKPNTASWVVETLSWADPENQPMKRKRNPATGWKFLQGEGIVEGHLIGGCIEVLDWLRGTAYWPEAESWQDAILFIETSEEAPTPDDVSYLLRALAAVGVLEKLSGILYARPGGPIPPEKFGAYDKVLQQIVAEENGLTALPIISGMDFGHTDPMFVLPYGVTAQIDCDAQTFSILESGVED